MFKPQSVPVYILLFFFSLSSCFYLPIPFFSQPAFERDWQWVKAALCLLHHFHNHWSWLTFRILGSISNSDILNHLLCQEPIETTLIKSLHQCCHPWEHRLLQQMGLHSLGYSFALQAILSSGKALGIVYLSQVACMTSNILSIICFLPFCTMALAIYHGRTHSRR